MFQKKKYWPNRRKWQNILYNQNGNIFQLFQKLKRNLEKKSDSVNQKPKISVTLESFSFSKTLYSKKSEVQKTSATPAKKVDNTRNI